MAVVFGKGIFQPEPEKTGTRQRTGKNPRVAEGFRVQTGREQEQVLDQDTDVFETKTRTVRLTKKVEPKDASPGGRKRLARYVVFTYTSDGRVSKEFRSTPDGEPIDIKGEKKIVSAKVADQQIKQYEEGGAKVKTTTGSAAKKDSNAARRERDRNAKKPERKKPSTTTATVGNPVRDSSGKLAFDPREPRTVELPGDDLAIRSDDLQTTRDRINNPSRPRPGDDRALRGKREKSPGKLRGIDKTLGLEFETTLGPKIDDGLDSKRTTRSLISRRKKKSSRKGKAKKIERELKPGYAKKTRANKTTPTKDVLGRNLARLRESSKQNPVVRIAEAQMRVDKQLEIQRENLAKLQRSPGTYSRGKSQFDETDRDRRNKDAELKESDRDRREGRGGSGVRGYVANSTEGQRVGEGEKRRIQNRIAQLQAHKEALSIAEEVQAGDFSRAGNVESLDEIMKQIDLDESQDLSFDDDDLQKPRSRGGGPAARTGLPPALSSGSLSDPARAASEFVFADERNEDLMNRGGETATNRRLMARRAEAARAASAPERIPGQGNPLEVLGPPRQRAGTAKADQEAIRLTRMLKELKEGRIRREDLVRLGMGGLAQQEARSRGSQNMVRELFRMLSGSVADTGVDRDQALRILSKIIRGGRG